MERKKEKNKLSDNELVSLSSKGDTNAAVILLDRYLPFIKSKSRKYFLQGAEKEDVLQEALVGFIEAVRDYDPEKNDSFSYFANLCVTRQIHQAINKFSRKKHQPLNTYISLDGPAPGFDEDSKSSLKEMIRDKSSTPEEVLLKKEKLELFEDKSSLSKLECKVLTLYMEGYSYEEICSMINKSYKSVDNALSRVKKKFYESVKSYYDI